MTIDSSPQPAAAQAAQPCNTYNGAGVSYFQVPAGVTQIEASVYGAEGGFVLPPNAQFGQPGKGGGVVGAMISVNPGETLEIRVGGAGLNSFGAQTPAPPGGFNGGGAGAVGSAHTSSTGGGASTILRGTQTLVIAGGGGGAAHGGAGGDGGQIGANGTKLAGSASGSTGGLAGGNGGTGGAGSPAAQAGGNGSAGQGGRGGGDPTTLPVDGGGGGGGGYVGGGGGGGGPGNGGSGGGGGSSFDSTGTATFQTGVETGDGRVTLSYNCAAAPAPQSCVTFDSPGTHSFQVPGWVHEVYAAVYGAQGGDVPNANAALSGAGGLGGAATGVAIPVTPKESLDVVVGGHGTNGGAPAPPVPAGGSPGGGDGGAETGSSGAGGGGASSIRRAAQTLVIAGGGGGGARGGDGGAGGFLGLDGTRKGASGGFGGRSGGNGGAGGGGFNAGHNGGPGQGGAGGGDVSTTGSTGGGGGGGAGAVGGGGGGAGGIFQAGSGGGGGGSSTQSLGQVPIAWQTGVETGDGRVVLAYDCRGTDLSIEKRASAGTVTAGGQVTYTLIIRNNGPADDTGVAVTDSIPAGLDVVSAQPGQGTCQIAAAVTCNLGDLAAGGSTQIVVTANVGNGVTGGVTNTADVNGDRDDTDPTNNHDERTITVDPPPPPLPPTVDLKVKKAVSASNANPGDQLTYTLVVTNDGPGDATDVKLVDTPPGEIRYASARAAQGNCDIDAGVLRCSLGNLPADGQTQVQITADVQARAGGTLRNVATVTAAEEDKNPKNNLDRQDITVPRPGGSQPRLDLQITKKASKVKPSGKVTYSLVVRNNGPDTAHDAVVVDTASRHLKVLSLKAPKGNRCKVGPPIRCTLGSVAKGKKVEIKVVAKLTEAGKLTNAASVASSDEDTKPKNNLAKATSSLQPQLEVAKRVHARAAPKGGRVAYTIAVKNPSSVAIRNVRVCDPLPHGLRLESSAPRASRHGTRACWRIRKLGGGQSKSFEIVVIVRASRGRVVNRATATAPGVQAGRDTAGLNVGGNAGRCAGAARLALWRC